MSATSTATKDVPIAPGGFSVGGHKVSVTNLQKPMYPTGFTKGQVLAYYLRIAPVMLPHLAGRATTLKRYPDGAASAFFYEKNCPSHRPPWVKTARVGQRDEPDADGPAYCLLNHPASLLWAANLASLELHASLAKAAAPDRPTAMVFDLDPGAPATLADCLRLGLKVRDLLAAVGLQSFPKTSGGKGLHVYVPLNTPGVTFDNTKAFARAVAQVLERQDPAGVTSSMAKAGRAGKVFVDWSQNDRHKTTVCAYSLRALARPTASCPLTWDEVARADRKGAAESLVFESTAALKRVDRLGDLFEPLLSLKQRLPRLSPQINTDERG